MTYGEELVEQGRLEARCETLAELLTLKFDELPREYQERLTNATEDQLFTYMRRFVSATTLADVFAD